jgi:hypothetical protein
MKLCVFVGRQGNKLRLCVFVVKKERRTNECKNKKTRGVVKENVSA